MRVIWLRHGETDGNQDKKYMGHTDIPLNQTGHDQAERLAQSLSQESIQAIYTSDLIRARQTAEKLFTYFPNLSIQSTPLLRECFFGEWEGLTYRDICAQDEGLFHRWYHNPFVNAPPQGETLTNVDQRLSMFLTQLEEKYSAKDCVVIFTHGGPLRWVWAKLIERNWQEMWKVNTPNAGGWMLEKTDETWRLIKEIDWNSGFDG
jgi:broad specificity phosphatase PhoE